MAVKRRKDVHFSVIPPPSLQYRGVENEVDPSYSSLIPPSILGGGNKGIIVPAL